MMLQILAGLISLVWASIVVGMALCPLFAHRRHEIDAKNPEPIEAPISDLSGGGVELADGSVICAACGHEAEFEMCGACDGEGGHDGYEEDPLWYHPGEIAPCPLCSGTGGELWCGNPNCKTQIISNIRKPNQTKNNPNETTKPHNQ